MAKLKVQGNASGTGVVTLTAPNTNTDRTITLPDGDISLGVGIDDNATSTAITIDASENVNIGSTTNYGGLLSVNRVRTSGIADLLTLRDGTSGATLNLQTYGDPTFGSASRFNYGGAYLAFRSGTTENIRFPSAGGITFNGDTAAANALDDYEEGTWTPTISSGITSPTYGAQTATYTKIGNSVRVSFNLDVSGGTLNTSQAIIGGLPFTAGGGDQPSVTWGYTQGVGLKNSCLPIALSNVNSIKLYTAGLSTTYLGTDLTSSTCYFRGTMMYHV